MLAARSLSALLATGLLLACQRPGIGSPASTTSFSFGAGRLAATAASSETLAPMEAEATTTPPAPRPPCAPLAWSRSEPPRAKAPPLVGMLTDARATDGAGAWTRYFILELEHPICDADGKGQDELQIVAGKGADLEAIAALSGRRVQVEGDASEVQTRDDHLPVVLRVRSVHAR